MEFSLKENLISSFINKKDKICVVGLGYVGLPLAVAFSKKFSVIGFDINKERICTLKQGIDSNNEINKSELETSNITYSYNPNVISECKLIIVAVPTPIDSHKTPDLSCVANTTRTIAKHFSPGSTVVYESTVYPGVTEDICVPILEQESSLVWKKDFFVGYSPERINPGDKVHTIYNVTKVVSGDTEVTKKFISQLYNSVIDKIHEAPSIQTAEAAKVIENTQRDLALINELSIIFNKMGIDTIDVLKAASTKWNFLKFEPGLVGGHCIGVDPYYLTYKAERLGYNPQVILSGRRLNDSMGEYIAETAIKKLIQLNKMIKGCKILILGFTFKENINDIRNTKIIDIYKELKEYGVDVFIHDPLVNKHEVLSEYSIELIDKPNQYQPYDAIILAVKHSFFINNYNLDYYKSISTNKNNLLIDVKAIYNQKDAESFGFSYWRL